jgi:hypothetical protein
MKWDDPNHDVALRNSEDPEAIATPGPELEGTHEVEGPPQIAQGNVKPIWHKFYCKETGRDFGGGGEPGHGGGNNGGGNGKPK